ncbi:MAG: hypothetical protein VB108_06935 [Anaerolineaceae bacterium]|nr:hypothetical protein [Anaerolineaceae bacterium]
MQKKSFSWFMRFLIPAGFLLFLNACGLQSARYPAPLSQPAKTAAATTGYQIAPLILAVLLLIAAIAAAWYFYTKGDLKKWIDEGLAMIRSKLDQSRFKNQKRRTEAEQLELMKELGRQAWQARVSDPSYAETYQELEACQADEGPMEDVVKAVQLELAKARDARNRLTGAFNQKVNDLQTQLNQMNESVNRLKSEQQAAAESLQKADERKRSLENEARSCESSIAKLQGSDQPDRDSQIASLNNNIATLGKTIYALGDQIAGLNSQTLKLSNDQGPYLTQIDNLKAQINQYTNEHKDALLPLDQQVSNLETNLKTRQTELAAIREKMAPIIESLGPKVEAARPDCAALQDLYQKLDVKKEQLSSATQGFELANSRIASGDKEGLRNFYLALGAALVLTALIVLLLVIAF